MVKFNFKLLLVLSLLIFIIGGCSNSSYNFEEQILDSPEKESNSNLNEEIRPYEIVSNEVIINRDFFPDSFGDLKLKDVKLGESEVGLEIIAIYKSSNKTFKINFIKFNFSEGSLYSSIDEFVTEIKKNKENSKFEDFILLGNGGVYFVKGDFDVILFSGEINPESYSWLKDTFKVNIKVLSKFQIKKIYSTFSGMLKDYFGNYSDSLIKKGEEQNQVEDEDYFLTANYDVETNEVYLNWDKVLDSNDFKYYKVVHSTTNSDLKYPDDGYIKYISDSSINNYVDKKEFIKGKTNYYRITYVFNDRKVNSNVITFEG